MCKRIVFNHLNDITLLKTNGYIDKEVDRASVKVCFIDNDGYDCAGLKVAGYKNVTVKDKFAEINDFGGYDIIACDIAGVGEDIDKNKQGLAVAEILKKAYPEKIVLVYSSNNPLEYDEKYYLVADGFFKKSDSAGSIALTFDEQFKSNTNPMAAWKKIENKLKIQAIPNKTIAFIEDKYVRSLLKKKNLFSKEEKNLAKALKIATDVITFVATIVSLFI